MDNDLDKLFQGRRPRFGLFTHKPMSEVIQEQRFFLLQPLFRVVAIVIETCDYNETMTDIGQIPTCIVRTGVEDGLSAPITLDPIPGGAVYLSRDTQGHVVAARTTLETAFDFLQALQQREISAFGMRPDPFESTRQNQSGYVLEGGVIRYEAQRLGWEGGFPEGPSSQWVDIDKYPE